MKKTKQFKKGDIVGRFFYELVFCRGWKVVETRETSGYDAGKGFVLFLFAPILAIFGATKYISVTYEKIQ